MKRLPRPPAEFTDADGRPMVGSFEGTLPAVDYAGCASTWRRSLQHKRWLFVMLAGPSKIISLGIVHAGYVGQLFAYSFDLDTGRRAFQIAKMIQPLGVRIGREVSDISGFSAEGLGFFAQFVQPEREGTAAVDLRCSGVELSARLRFGEAPPPLSAVVDLGSEHWGATEKRILAPVEGTLRLGEEAWDLSSFTGGYDFSSGILPYHTRWRWSWGMGKTEEGVPFGFNLVDGFLGAAECAAWVGGELWPLSEGRIAIVGREASVRTEDGRMVGSFRDQGRFEMHKNLGPLRGRFSQQAGELAGRLRARGHDLKFSQLVSVVEDQNVHW